MTIATINPATGQTLQRFDPYSSEEVERRIIQAAESFHDLRTTTFETRAKWTRAAADLLDTEVEELASTLQ